MDQASRFRRELLSPPSRAAWIEISGALADAAGVLVAAFTGGVD